MRIFVNVQRFREQTLHYGGRDVHVVKGFDMKPRKQSIEIKAQIGFGNQGVIFVMLNVRVPNNYVVRKAAVHCVREDEVQMSTFQQNVLPLGFKEPPIPIYMSSMIPSSLCFFLCGIGVIARQNNHSLNKKSSSISDFTISEIIRDCARKIRLSFQIWLQKWLSKDLHGLSCQLLK